jgi:tight adherence protein C
MDPLIILALLLICLPLAYLAWSLLSVDRKGLANARALLSRGHPPG